MEGKSRTIREPSLPASWRSSGDLAEASRGLRVRATLQRVVLRSGATFARPASALAYRAIAMAFARYLTWREAGASVYVTGGLGGPDFMPGLSDVDLTVVLAQDRAGPGLADARTRRRWQRLRSALPFTELVLDWPCIYERAELDDLTGHSAMSYGLHGDEPAADRAAYFRKGSSLDRIRMLERPGLYGPRAGWRLISGPERRPPDPTRGPEHRQVAAWLELVFWWRQLFVACVDPRGPRLADLCVKCVAEAARIWLWLEHGLRVPGRVAALRRALDLMPEEDEALRRTLDLHRSLPLSPDPPLAETLGALTRISARIAALIDTRAEAGSATEVTLAGGGADDLVLPGGDWKPPGSLARLGKAQLLPLSDWRSLACPLAPDDSFAPLNASPHDPDVLVDAARLRAGPYPTLMAGGLMIRPGADYLRTRLRAVQCRASDPVSFALVDGKRVAAFPGIPGWSALDTARRGVAEHRAWLRLTAAQATNGAPPETGRDLGMLLTAARAALFLESIGDGQPMLALTVAEAARALGARSAAAQSIADEALGCYRELATRRGEPAAQTVRALRDLVLALPPYPR